MRNPITKEGFEKLKEKLRKLKEEERPRVIKAIEEARAHGDISENAELDAAKAEQEILEKKIKEIENSLSIAEVIDVSKFSGGKVLFGAFVTLYDLDKNEEITYQIVGVDESDIKEGRISFKSPIGMALIGKEEGEEVIVQAPKGRRSVVIKKVWFK